MKKIIFSLAIAAIALSLTGCAGEEDNIFEKSAAERLNESSDTATMSMQVAM